MPKFFVTDIASEADIKVHVTDVRTDGQAVIFETTDQWEATNPLVWFYTDIRSEADKLLCFVDSAFDADLTIFKTDIQSDAEWLDSYKSDLL